MRFLLLLLALLAPMAVSAHWKPKYASNPVWVRAWYESAKVMPQAQKRLHFSGCCDTSDVVKTKFKLDKSTGAPHWFFLKNGKWTKIPDDIIHWNEQAPDSKATLFALSDWFNKFPPGTPTCFYPPGGGF